MSKRSQNLLVSIAVMCIAVAFFEVWFRHSDLGRALKAEESFSAMVTHFEAFERDPDVVVIGDSRIRHDVDTSVIETIVGENLGKPIIAWNLGRGGVIGQAQLALTLRALDRKHPPHLIIMFVDPTGFLVQTRPSLDHQVKTKIWKLEDIPSVIRAGASLEETLEIAVNAAFSTMRYRERLLEVVFHDKDPGPSLPPDNHGFKPLAQTSGKSQQNRAIRRGNAYLRRYKGKKVNFKLSDFKVGSLREAIRQALRAGSKVVLINSPASSPVIKIASGKNTIVPQYMSTMHQIAFEMGIEFLDHSIPPVINDDNYHDSDHMDNIGAKRYTNFLTHEVILPLGYEKEIPSPSRWGKPMASEGCRVLFDFEQINEGYLEGWTRSGEALEELLATGRRGDQSAVVGFKGLGFLSSYHREHGFKAKGMAVSPEFEIDKPIMKMLVAGGKDSKVELVIDGQVVRIAPVDNTNGLTSQTWDVGEFQGKRAIMRVVDGGGGKRGFVALDQVELCK